jgi:5-(aminomethyl)-3-furanmethanol phosphate kinase
VSGGVAPGALTVVKLGGSFAFSPDLPGLLDAMEAAAAPLVIVAGGGPFADTVRLAQPRMRFDERAAHRMALLAMAQYAEALCSLSPRFQVAANLAAIREAIGAGRLPIWSPWPLADGLETLPESWDLTSDSLAAWLSGRLQASRLLLLKHRDPPASPMSLRQIAKLGIVDPLFPDYARQSGASVCWLGPSQFPALTAILDGREAAGLSLGREIREHHHA